MFGNKWVLLGYISVIMYMYDGTNTSVSTVGGAIEQFPVDVGLHHRLTLCPFLFAIVMDELMRNVQGDVPWCMLFADDIVLIDVTRGLK